MPLHVPVSEAILTDSKGLSAVLDMLQFYPDLARLLVLSIPAVSIGGRHEQALDMLASKGVRFAAEGWDEAVDMADPLPAGLSFLKVPANRLLDRERARRKAGTRFDHHRTGGRRQARDHCNGSVQRRGRRQPDRPRRRPDVGSAFRRSEAAEAGRSGKAVGPACTDLIVLPPVIVNRR